jgi:hypothetical protein
VFQRGRSGWQRSIISNRIFLDAGTKHRRGDEPFLAAAEKLISPKASFYAGELEPPKISRS